MNKTIPAIQYCKSIFDGTHDTPKPARTGFPLITSKHITNGVMDISSAYLIAPADYATINIRSKVSQWDILFSMIGTVGEIYLEKNEKINYVIKNIGVFSCQNEKKAKWLYYYLKSPTAKNHIRRYLNGAVQKFLSLGVMREFPVLPYDEIISKGIDLIATIDAKIQLNNCINTKLEAMAKTLHDYWFVQFDFPDVNGKPYKTSGGKMVYNPALKREIPDGWSDTTIGNLESNIVTGKTPSKEKSEYFKGSVPFVTIGDVRNNTFIVETEETLTTAGANSQPNKYLPEDTICVTCIASPGLVGFLTGVAQTNQQINSIICKKNYNRYFLYFSINNYFAGAKAKTGNTFANMNKSDFSNIVLIQPNENILTCFHNQVYPIFNQIKVRAKENNQLRKLQDWLLPMLMNGQVTVK